MNSKKGLRDHRDRISIDGMFLNKINTEDNFRTCKILGAEIRVWGAEGIRGLSKEVTSALRPIIKRLGSCYPIALMADYHPAEFGVVGSVIASDRYLIPDLIGSDCGCGVFACCSGYSVEQLTTKSLKEIYSQILKCVPVGTLQNPQLQMHLQQIPLWDQLQALEFVSKHELRKLQYQLGTLGSGNHFIELAVDSNNKIWLLVHSGSRYLGGLLKQYYQGLEILLDSDQAAQFIKAQAAVIEYAKISRKEIAKRVLNCIRGVSQFEIAQQDPEIDLVHNFIQLRLELGTTLVLHRKGACSAEEGQLGIIPGSMKDGSYIVEGRGSSASYNSSSHGAGRVMSRGAAFRSLSYRALAKDMQGIIWGESEKLKDESPRAYKDLEDVVRAQRDLLRVRDRLLPILSIKGEV